MTDLLSLFFQDAVHFTGKLHPTADFTLRKEVKDAWVKALRSGEFKQGRNYLRIVSRNGEASYCCLGVLCHILGVPDTKLHSVSMPQKLGLYAKDDSPEDLLDYRVLDPSRDAPITSLAALNDAGSSFAEIADIIEQQVPTHE